MNYTRKFESFKKDKKTKDVTPVSPEAKVDDTVNETVTEAGNMFKVITTIDVPSSLVNAYAKKVKDTFEKDITTSWGKAGIAEELVKFVNMTFLNVDAIHAGALTGDPDPAAQMQAQPAPMAQVQPGVQPQAQVQVPQGQVQGQPVLDPQAQVQVPQGQVQAQAQVQGQPLDPATQAQAQAQVPPAQNEFEEVQDDDEFDDEKDEDSLPL